MKFLRTGIIIGPLYLHYYGAILVVGILLGTKLASKAGEKRGWKTDDYWDMLPWALVFGVIGARLWHVLIPSESSGITLKYYLEHPLEILKTWNGGLGIPDGILGGAFGIWLFCRRRQISFPAYIDTIGIGLPLGQAIGRWGNFVNQELYGLPSDLPWAIPIDPEYRLPQYAEQATYHPLFLYEGLLNLCLCFVLWKLYHREPQKLKDGSFFLIYLVGYSAIRFFLEFIRVDRGMAGELNLNQCVMAVVFAAALTALIIREKAPQK